MAPAAGCPRRLSTPRSAASAPPALVFGPVLQVFRLRGKQLPRTGLFTGRFASTSGRSDRASRGAEAKPPVANDVLCHEVEKLARAALFPASAAFAPVRSGQTPPDAAAVRRPRPEGEAHCMIEDCALNKESEHSFAWYTVGGERRRHAADRHDRVCSGDGLGAARRVRGGVVAGASVHHGRHAVLRRHAADVALFVACGRL